MKIYLLLLCFIFSNLFADIQEVDQAFIGKKNGEYVDYNDLINKCETVIGRAKEDQNLNASFTALSEKGNNIKQFIRIKVAGNAAVLQSGFGVFVPHEQGLRQAHTRMCIAANRRITGVVAAGDSNYWHTERQIINHLLTSAGWTSMGRDGEGGLGEGGTTGTLHVFTDATPCGTNDGGDICCIRYYHNIREKLAAANINLHIYAKNIELSLNDCPNVGQSMNAINTNEAIRGIIQTYTQDYLNTLIDRIRGLYAPTLEHVWHEDAGLNVWKEVVKVDAIKALWSPVQKTLIFNTISDLNITKL